MLALLHLLNLARYLFKIINAKIITKKKMQLAQMVIQKLKLAYYKYIQ